MARFRKEAGLFVWTRSSARRATSAADPPAAERGWGWRHLTCMLSPLMMVGLAVRQEALSRASASVAIRIWLRRMELLVERERT